MHRDVLQAVEAPVNFWQLAGNSVPFHQRLPEADEAHALDRAVQLRQHAGVTLHFLQSSSVKRRNDGKRALMAHWHCLAAKPALPGRWRSPASLSPASLSFGSAARPLSTRLNIRVARARAHKDARATRRCRNFSCPATPVTGPGDPGHAAHAVPIAGRVLVEQTHTCSPSLSEWSLTRSPSPSEWARRQPVLTPTPSGPLLPVFRVAAPSGSSGSAPRMRSQRRANLTESRSRGSRPAPTQAPPSRADAGSQRRLGKNRVQRFFSSLNNAGHVRPSQAE